MGVTLDLRMIDHEHVVERGLPVVNAALAAHDPSILVDYILGKSFAPNPELIAFHQARYDRLRAMKAPAEIVQIEERTLRLVNGDAYSRDALQKQTLDELRELLGTWGWPQNSFSICQTWYELDWFLQPAEGPDYILMFPLRPKTGDPSQTPIDWALCGAQSSPRDNSGAPIIRYCGSKHDDCFGYNPPDVVASIHAVLSTIDDQAWNDLVPQRIDQYQRANSEWGDNLAAVVSNELENARIAFAEMRQAYHAAQEQGFGIACEYSL